MYYVLVKETIHEAAGPMLKLEIKSRGVFPEGEAVVSGGYKLPAKCKTKLMKRNLGNTHTFQQNSRNS